jgi:hypothetical protein
MIDSIAKKDDRDKVAFEGCRYSSCAAAYRNLTFHVLPSQRVRAHDDNCECSGNDSKPFSQYKQPNAVFALEDATEEDNDMEAGRSKTPSLKPAASYDTQDTTESVFLDENECPICMSPFKIDEIVSWSPNEQCNHVCK